MGSRTRGLRIIISSRKPGKMPSYHAIVRGVCDDSAPIFLPDFSVVLFRPNFMLASEEYPMKAHKNQWLLTMLSPPAIPCGGENQGTHHGVWRADAFAVT